MAGISAVGRLIKGAEMSFDHDSEFMWQEDAACRFMPYTMFEVASHTDAIAEGMDTVEIKELNATNFSAAKKVCDKCPVQTECLESATEGDLNWTMRAGRMPARLNLTAVGRPAKGSPESKPPYCTRCGEDDLHYVAKQNRWSCRECGRRANKDSPTPSAPKLAGTGPCRICGAEEFAVRLSSRDQSPYRQCMPCKRRNDKESGARRTEKARQKREAAKLKA